MAYIVLMIWGVFYERYHYQVNRVEIACDALPAKFDGFKIVQISDLHAGSLFGSVHRMERLTDMVNRQQADIIVFTGDFVNNFAEEIVPVIPIFSRMEALTGKFAILGNHDYGIYYKWETPAGKAKNQQELEKNIALMGFDLLKNRATVIEKDSANRIAIAGVENWGIRKRHPKLGNIATATASVQDVPFKILLSHDPSFWQEHIKGKTDIPLTLSGHTHGMQMGVRLGEKRYSPAQMAHTYFAGLYRENDQYLYVNTGLGVIGFPGRIGMPPEITVITLKTRL
jgi:predicted MPP superfamily phosphohydrolase